MAAAEQKNESLQLSSTLPQASGLLDWLFAAFIHITVWGGSMILGPLLLLGSPLFLLLHRSTFSIALCVVVVVLCFMPPLPESPTFCKLYLRTSALLSGGSTLWVAEQIKDHLSEAAMVCYHPHGVLPLGYTMNGAIRAKTRDQGFLHPEIPISHRVSGVQAPILFKMPILRQVLQLFGCTMPATKAGMSKLFRQKMTFGIIPGGSEEVALHIRGRERLFIKKRAGFLKYALQYGFKVVVTYNFGESDLYDNASFVRPLNLWLVRRFGFVLPLFWGRIWCPLLPRRGCEINSVMGEILHLPRIDDPSAKDVDEWHGKYIEALERLFDTHKHQFGYGSRKLEMW